MRGPPLRRIDLDPNLVEARVEGCHTAGYLAKYREHIRRHGVKVPILVWARDGRLTVHSGNTRVLVCRDLGIPVPAIVADWDARFPDAIPIPDLRRLRQQFPSGLLYLDVSDDIVTLAPVPIPIEA